MFPGNFSHIRVDNWKREIVKVNQNKNYNIQLLYIFYGEASDTNINTGEVSV